MPISFTDGGGVRPGKSAGPLTSRPDKGAFTPAPVAAPEPGWPDAVAIGQAAVATVLARLEPVTVEVYTVRRDGLACPECGPYDGSLWDEGEGPQPPLHPNCRCRRLPHHVEWRTPR